jgi:hypothetical protein
VIRFEVVDGLLCLVFICAQCGKPISGQDGIVQWDGYDEPTFTALHKGPDKPCTWQWEREHSRDEWTGWEDADSCVATSSTSGRAIWCQELLVQVWHALIFWDDLLERYAADTSPKRRPTFPNWTKGRPSSAGSSAGLLRCSRVG